MGLFVSAILRLLCDRRRLLLENLALRQQLAALKRRRPRPRLAMFDRVFWVLARKFWSGWKQALMIVSPETVVRWHRSGFAMYWRAISRGCRIVGRRRISKELRDLIFRMVAAGLRRNAALGSKTSNLSSARPVVKWFCPAARAGESHGFSFGRKLRRGTTKSCDGGQCEHCSVGFTGQRQNTLNVSRFEVHCLRGFPITSD